MLIPCLSPVDYFLLLFFKQDGEVSEELLNFHEVVSHIERLEEEVCDDHAALCNVSCRLNHEPRDFLALPALARENGAPYHSNNRTVVLLILN